MTDLLEVLPDFDVKPYSHLLHSLEKTQITVSDLVTLDSVEIVKACPLPLGDVRDLIKDIVEALQREVGIRTAEISTSSGILADVGTARTASLSSHLLKNVLKEPAVIKTLDPAIDEAIGGGIHTGCITEIAGESAAGKTQLVLGLLLSVQLPPPYGLSRNAIYISTESPLNTDRLQQLRSSHPIFTSHDSSDYPSFDNIYSIPVNDLEAQEHIIEYQLPIAVKQYNVGLVVMDSVTANFRAEFESRTVESLSARAKDLSKLGTIFRAIALEHNLAIVVTNQVSDRFDETHIRITQEMMRSSSPGFSSSPAAPNGTQTSATLAFRRDEVMSLDHQQRFFTGWGNEHDTRVDDLKTPALGMAWTNQIAARIVLKVESERLGQRPETYMGGNLWSHRKRRRFLEVVFAPWAKPTEMPVEYEIMKKGIVAVTKREDNETGEEWHGKHSELLDEKLWGFDGADEEFP